MLDKKIAEKKAAQSRTTLSAYRRLFSTEDGKIVMKDLMTHSFFYSESAVAGDPYATYFNEGTRSMILRIVRLSKQTSDDIDRLAEELSKDNGYDI